MTRLEAKDLLARGFSRRSFAKISTLLTAGATLPFYNEPALAQLSALGPLPPDAVKINANENPLGPCAEACEAMYNAVRNGGRYSYEEATNLTELLAAQEGLRPEFVQPYAGSSDPLYRTIVGFTSPSRSLVVAEPTYESAERGARFVGASVIRVPLTPDFRHDVKAMVKADSNSGVIYICSPNNPTGTLTPRADIEWLVANKPAGCVILLDEAYIHLSASATPSTDLVAREKDIIVLRTFSKLYGMAGLRAGAAMARPDLLEKIRPTGSGGLPVPAMVGAQASLKSKNLVAERRRIIRDIREDVFEFLTAKSFSFVPSESNKFMLDVKRPGQEVVRAMAAEKIYIGRVWPAWPTHVRVTIGTREEMEKFKAALLKVMA